MDFFNQYQNNTSPTIERSNNNIEKTQSINDMIKSSEFILNRPKSSYKRKVRALSSIGMVPIRMTPSSIG
jgi:hypothetical protein